MFHFRRRRKVNINKVVFCNNGIEKMWSSIKSELSIKSQTKSRVSHQRCSIKKMFLENSQNSQENTYVRHSFSLNFIKKVTPT